MISLTRFKGLAIYIFQKVMTRVIHQKSSILLSQAYYNTLFQLSSIYLYFQCDILIENKFILQSHLKTKIRHLNHDFSQYISIHIFFLSHTSFDFRVSLQTYVNHFSEQSFARFDCSEEDACPNKNTHKFDSHKRVIKFMKHELRKILTQILCFKNNPRLISIQFLRSKQIIIAYLEIISKP